jgi:hypothetical protein
MEIIGWVIGVAGLVAMLVGSISLIVLAFQQETMWGCACLFIPFVALVFTIMYWEKARKPFGIWVIGWVIGVIGLLLGKFMRDGQLVD